MRSRVSATTRDLAATLLQLETWRRQDALLAPIATEAIAKFIAGDIDEATLTQWVNGAAPRAT
jgi:hypothetical protein